LHPTARAFSIYPDAPKNEKISGGITRGNEYGTHELRRKPLKIHGSSLFSVGKEGRQGEIWNS
jgi:hypothetical protein